jgi:hypothetical protein
VHDETQLLREGAHPLIERHDRELIVEMGPEVHLVQEPEGNQVHDLGQQVDPVLRPGSSSGSFCARAALLISITHSTFSRLDESRSEDPSHSRVTLRSTLCSSKPERMTLESKQQIICPR